MLCQESEAKQKKGFFLELKLTICAIMYHLMKKIQLVHFIKIIPYLS